MPPPIRSTPIQDIRSDSMTYQNLIIFTLNRISQHTYQASESPNPDKLKALEAEIGFLDSFVGPYYTEEYGQIIIALEKLLDGQRHYLESDQRREFQKLLRQWIKEIIKRLGSPGIGILPAISTSYTLGEGYDK